MINIENLNTQEKMEKLELITKKLNNNVSDYFTIYYTVKTIQLATEYADYMNEKEMYPNEENNHDTYIHAITEALELVCKYMLEKVCDCQEDMIEHDILIRDIIENTSLRRIK